MNNLRKCTVLLKREYVPAWFHGWGQRSEVIPPSYAIGGHSGGRVDYVVGICELEDGRIVEMLPTDIKFDTNPADEEAKNNELMTRRK